MSTAIATRRPIARRRGRRAIAILLVLIGVVTLLYPVAATQYNNYRQREFAQRYNQEVQQEDPDALADDVARARSYNQTLSGVPILDPWLLKAGDDPGSDAYRTYAGELSRFGAMARIQVPSVGIDLPVYHGTSDPVLAKGAGHLYGTSLPVGGNSTHAVLTSHTGLANATLFDHLSSVEEGDLMLVSVAGEVLAYEVDQIKVVLPSEIGDLVTVNGHDYLTLFTCTPCAVNTHRLLVRGERVDYDPGEVASVGQNPSIVIESWMWLLMGGAAFGVAALATLVVRSRRSRRG